MKTLLAAVLAAVALMPAAPALAGSGLGLRGLADAAAPSAPARTEARPTPAPVAAVTAAPARKVRVVLASPYGN